MPADEAPSSEDASKRSEREAIQRDARQVGRTYRGMGRLNGIADTPHDVREQWRERITTVERRRDRYAERWGLKLPSLRLFNPTGGVRQDWLQEMVDVLDGIVWQLDNEYLRTSGVG